MNDVQKVVFITQP